tara:strand:- start:136 stop:435 length:300 start_codon:yes stop_codon:yes gene_type:complete
MNNINVNAWVELKNENAVLVDVRTFEEYNEGHIKDSLHIDIFSPSFIVEIEKLEKNKDYYIICKSGGRSMTAGEAMENIGFSKVTNLAGGMMAWMGEQV